MSRTFGEIIDDYMKLNDELEKKVYYDFICGDRIAVVRCKDCGHWKSDGHVQWCDVWKCGTSELGYCHRSNRREDGEA